MEEVPANPYAGTQTEKNLQVAFAGESEARNKYTYYSSVAKKEGYEQIAALFLKTAENEKGLVQNATAESAGNAEELSPSHQTPGTGQNTARNVGKSISNVKEYIMFGLLPGSFHY